MKYSVNFHPLAQIDYRHIYEYIASRSSGGARSWDAALDEAIEALRNDPNIFGRIPEPVSSEQAYRQHLFKTKYGNRYRLVYAVENDLVTILRIRGPGQPPVAGADIAEG